MLRAARLTFYSLFFASLFQLFSGATPALACAGGIRLNLLSVSNYPNPFNPGTTVRYTVPSRGAVHVSIYDARGALVRTLFEGNRGAGSYTAQWDGHADDGATVGSGIYFVRIEHNGAFRTKKMVLLK
jgi:hypothetical protein